MNSDVDLKKLFMNNCCRMKKLNLYVQTCEALRRFLILDWAPTPKDLEQIDSVITYIQKLPVPILEDLFLYCKSPNKGHFTFYYLKCLEAHHVTLFTYRGQKEMKMDFKNDEFDLEFYLRVCEHKMQDLEELKLPACSQLTANQSRKLSESVPNLRCLSLFMVDIATFAIQFIANLSLEELELSGSAINLQQINRGFVDPQLAVLCHDDSAIRQSLLVLKTGSIINLESFILVLRSMPNLEYLDCFSGSWMAKLPPDMTNRKFSLKHLHFCSLSPQMELELSIASNCCPVADTLDVTTDTFTSKMPTLLSQFPHLSTLDFKVVSSKYFTNNVSGVGSIPTGSPLPPNTPINPRNGILANLSELSIRDRRNGWLCKGNNLTNLLSICPELSKLTLTECNGFDDAMALQTSRELMRRHVDEIHCEFCNLLRPQGIHNLLTIPSVAEYTVELLLTTAQSRLFDVERLKEEARRKGKKLKIEITIRTFLHDFLASVMP